MLSRLKIRARLLMVVAVPVVTMALGVVLQQSGSKAPAGRPGLVAGIAAVAAAVSVILALWVAASIVGPLTRLRVAAERGAGLPGLVEALRQPGGPADKLSLRPLGLVSGDEVGRAARAFDGFQASAAALVAQQAALLEKGQAEHGTIEVFLAVARRIQQLVDHQIELLDRLEAAEKDPRRKASLLELEQLTAGVRRHAESLLTIGGASPAPDDQQPVPITDVIRSGIAEADDPGRVDLAVHDEVTVLAGAAAGAAHLLSELVQNAIRWSPPDARVMVRSEWGPAGYQVSVRDNGVGLAPHALAEANRILSSPPPATVAARGLGLVVTGRVARRLGISVHLADADNGGITATVHVPPALIVAGGPAEAGEASALERPRTVLFGLAREERRSRLASRRGQEPERTPPPARAAGDATGAGSAQHGGAAAGGQPAAPAVPAPTAPPPPPPASADPTVPVLGRPQRPVRFASASGQPSPPRGLAPGFGARRKPAEDEFQRHLERATANGLVRRTAKAPRSSETSRRAHPTPSVAGAATAVGLPEEVRALLTRGRPEVKLAHDAEPDPTRDAGQAPA